MDPRFNDSSKLLLPHVLSRLLLDVVVQAIPETSGFTKTLRIILVVVQSCRAKQERLVRVSSCQLWEP